jgi:hypothetical protein
MIANRHTVKALIDTSGGDVTDQTIFTVPTGYNAIVTMWFQVNISGSTGTYSSHWNSGGVAYPFMSAKSLASGEHIEFGGNDMWIVMDAGDTFDVSAPSGHDTTIFVSYQLVRVS